MAECPKRKKEVGKPKKTWKKAGRKDKSGKRTELTIGLFECFYLGEAVQADGTRLDRRSDYLTVALDAT